MFRSETDVPFDHTSVIATILNQFGIDKNLWQLGSRTANAPTFENVITPRLDEVIQEVCQALGQSNRNKNRVTFYYLLVVILKKESVFI